MDESRLKDFTLKGFAQVCPSFGASLRKTSAVAMPIGERDSMYVDSARRRWERRHLCFLRHEEMAVLMALARAKHHVKSMPPTENWLRKRYKYSKNYKSTEDKHETNHINNKCNDMNMNTRKMHNT